MNDTPNWALTKREETAGGTAKYIDQLFQKRKEEFASALKTSMTPAFFRRLVMTAFTSNPRLLECDQVSIYQSALQIAQLQLEPNTPLGEAYLIPYGKKCTVQIGRNGWIKLAFRTGLISDVNALPIYRGEEFTWQPGEEKEIIHSPDIEIAADAELVAAYAWADMKDGRRIYEVLRKFEWEKIRDNVLKHGRSPAWKEHPGRMACRSALKRLIRTRLPVNEEFVNMHEEVFSLAVEEEKEVIDEDTGEVIEVSRVTEQSNSDGSSNEPARDTSSNNTKLSAAVFWKELGAASKYWKMRYSKEEVSLKCREMGYESTVGRLSSEQRRTLLERITNDFADKSDVEYTSETGRA